MFSVLDILRVLSDASIYCNTLFVVKK